MSMVERVAQAILVAQSELKRFGSYDYSGYPGEAPPFVVKDHVAGKELFRSNSGVEASVFYHKICADYVARAAIKAMREPQEPMVTAGVEYRLKTAIDSANHWRADTASLFTTMIDVTIKEPNVQNEAGF